MEEVGKQPYCGSLVYVCVIAHQAEVRQEVDDPNQLAHVEALISDHHPHFGQLLGYLAEHVGIMLF